MTYCLTAYRDGSETVVRRFDSLDDPEAIRQWGRGDVSLREIDGEGRTRKLSPQDRERACVTLCELREQARERVAA